MIKRVSLVWKRRGLSDQEFRRIWLGEHVEYARQLLGLRGYNIDFVTEGVGDGPSAIATLHFDSRQALEAAFSVPHIMENLMRTREQFAESVQVMIVEEVVVVPQSQGAES